MGRETKNKNYKCEFCGHYFSTERRLRDHISKVHPEKMNYVCEECGRGFFNLKALLIHVTKVHDDKLYFDKYLRGNLKCEYIHCNKDLDYENRYRGTYCCLQHCESQNRINKGIELNYICPICNSGFDEIGKLNWHFTRSHNFTVSQVKDYYDEHFKKDGEGFCKWCGKDTSFSGTFTYGYSSFCYNSDCNVRYHNKNNNRHKVAGRSNSETIKRNPEKYSNKIEYWLSRGYDKDTATKKLSERQRTFTKEKLILKYGEEEGLKRWVDRQERWQKSFKKQNYSMVSQELFWILYENIKNKFSNVYFATNHNGKRVDGKNYEYRLKTRVTSRMLDFYIPEIEKVIEFDGSYWHGDVGRGNRTRDENRDLEIIESKPEIKIYHVKELSYKKDKQKVINECLDFIGE
ncbi:MAG: hypothetical protein ACOCZ5_00150 [bacterium]